MIKKINGLKAGNQEVNSKEVGNKEAGSKKVSGFPTDFAKVLL